MAVKRYSIRVKDEGRRIRVECVPAANYDQLYCKYRGVVEKVHRMSALCFRMADALQSDSTCLVGMRHKKLVNDVLVDWSNENKL